MKRLAVTVFVGYATAVAIAGNEDLPALARKQIGVTVSYDPSYVQIKYPMGDLPPDRGVCTDVIIRALRLMGLDLQKAVHEDMSAHFAAYPKLWGLKRTDKNIDHRRVPNLMKYFERRGWSIPVTYKASDYLPGDLVTCLVGGSLPHIFIVSDRCNDENEPLIIHNIGSGVQEEEGIFEFRLTGHYRRK